jgi:uncharacterized protein (DUF1800 family)
MHFRKILLVPVLSFLTLASCGGGGGSNTPQPPAPVTLAQISLEATQNQAYETNNQAAEITVTRSGNSAPLSVDFTTDGNADSKLGSVSNEDYELIYGDGSAVGSKIEFAQNQNARTIQIKPLTDNQREVPETLKLTITAGTGYTLSDTVSAEIVISEARNQEANKQLFLGTFKAQDGANTNASGLLSFILQGDNNKGILTYTYANLGTQRTDQHIHLWPSGTIVHDIKDKDLESNGNVSGYEWDMEPGGIFTTKQQMLDALFNGEFYINIHSAAFPGGEIYAHLVYDASAEPPQQDELTSEEVDYDIVRFLTQATFGATPEDYDELRVLIDSDGKNRLQVYDLWIENQFSMPTTSMLDLDKHIYAQFPSYNHTGLQPQSFWPITVFAKDQLRQRMAFALSEILVISRQDGQVRNKPRGVGSYWDTLSSNAFGSYRNLLEEVALHPIMGVYLSHLRNGKADEAAGTYPDENFAREVMQLFTFGLVHRNKDGSIILGENNLPVPTYNNQTIQNMARVFTGLGLSYRADSEGNNPTENTNFNRANCGPANSLHYCWTQPMKFFPNFHDFDEKVLFSDRGQALTIPASTAGVDEALSELDTVLDALVSHSTTAPFLARRLIQRFVTSNPSSTYIERVANAFGPSGDMQAVIKAILLDPEARSPAVAKSKTFGKFKEPLLQFTAVMRLFQAGSRIALGAGDEQAGIIGTNYSYADHFDPGASIIKLGFLVPVLGQEALSAPSVFNFFSPDYAPTGELASQGLVAPELSLVTETQIYAVFNLYDRFLNNGVVNRPDPFSNDEARVLLNNSRLDAIWEEHQGSSLEKATAVVDFIDFFLNSGKLKQTANQGTRQELISAVESAACVSQPICDRYNLAIYGTATAPEFQIQQ